LSCLLNLTASKSIDYTNWVDVPALSLAIEADIYATEHAPWSAAIAPYANNGTTTPQSGESSLLLLPPSSSLAASHSNSGVFLSSYRLLLQTDNGFFNSALFVHARFQVAPQWRVGSHTTMPMACEVNTTIQDWIEGRSSRREEDTPSQLRVNNATAGFAPACVLHYPSAELPMTDAASSAPLEFDSYGGYYSSLFLAAAGQARSGGRRPTSTGSTSPLVWPGAPLWVQLRLSSVHARATGKSLSVDDIAPRRDGQGALTNNSWHSGFWFNTRYSSGDDVNAVHGADEATPAEHFRAGNVTVLLHLPDSDNSSNGSNCTTNAPVQLLRFNFTSSLDAASVPAYAALSSGCAAVLPSANGQSSSDPFALRAVQLPSGSPVVCVAGDPLQRSGLTSQTVRVAAETLRSQLLSLHVAHPILTAEVAAWRAQRCGDTAAAASATADSTGDAGSVVFVGTASMECALPPLGNVSFLPPTLAETRALVCTTVARSREPHAEGNSSSSSSSELEAAQLAELAALPAASTSWHCEALPCGNAAPAPVLSGSCLQCSTPLYFPLTAAAAAATLLQGTSAPGHHLQLCLAGSLSDAASKCTAAAFPSQWSLDGL
jgi:hypothetical protein